MLSTLLNALQTSSNDPSVYLNNLTISQIAVLYPLFIEAK
jgi:hypothetical protein